LSLPELYLSRPGVHFPRQQFDNEAIIQLVRKQFRGTEMEWKSVRSGIDHLFGLCGTQLRYLETDLEARVADYAVQAARACLVENETDLNEVDLVICGGIPRQYFEPATAMEVAHKLGLKSIHAFDVTAACVGHLEAIQCAAAYMTIHPNYRKALICTAELCYDYLSYDIQHPRDMRMKGAGLTIGNGSACVLLTRTPLAQGGLRLLGTDTFTDPSHWELCQVPIGGKFSSSSVELMRLGKLIPPVTQRNLDALGLGPRDIAHYVFHQPSEIMVRKILEDIGADPAQGVYTHHLYGNTASASVAITFDHLLKQRRVEHQQKIVLGSAAAGFSAVMVTGEWTQPASAAR